MSALGAFSPATRAWFDGAFAAATPAQAGAWSAVSKGEHALVVAPTGSGKTLAAFLWSLDRLATAPRPADPGRRCRVVYVSPLKALAVDVERNLRSPLAGIRQTAQRLGLPEPEIEVGMRTGDTPAADRRAFARTPPDILITTPESLFLLLTSQARDALRGVETVIVDEVHAVCGTKRGAHLALCLERLDVLTGKPVQRIGLSATVRPVEEVAVFLGGAQPVTVVQPKAAKTVELTVEVPVEDMTELGAPSADLTGAAAGPPPRASIWPAVEARVLELVEAHRSTIVFANSRRLAERLCARLNELVADAADPVGTRTPAEMMAQAGGAAGAPPIVARAHHGSVSREQRREIEEDLKAGRLPAVVATSSLELGIDMGSVDLVIQVEAPPSVAAGLQRVGRAGHQVGAVSRGVVFPKHRGDLLQCAVVVERMRDGAIESMRYPRNPLDVLAQQIVAMVSMDPWQLGELADMVRRAAPYAELPDSALEAVLDMLSGRYPSDDFAELRPRIVWDRLTGTLTARPGAHRLAVTSGGTIPDRGLFGVFLASGKPGEPGRRVGELDEEMVYESRVGDVFLLGSSSWRIEEITHDRVLVSPAPGQPAKMPFWKGDSPGRPVELGRALGAFVRELGRLDRPAALARTAAAGLDERASRNLLDYLAEQRAATKHLPDDRTILVERFRDELGDWRVAVHSLFGAPVNGPWALAIAARLRERHGMDAQVMHTDDGIVLRLPDLTGEAATPGADLAAFDEAEVEPLVTAEVGGSALFASRFRECAARALLLPRRNPGRRTPLWQQRQRAAQLLGVASEFGSFPIVLETMRECLQDVFDVPGLTGLMRDVAARSVRLVEVETPAPSPFARSLLFSYVGAFLYEGDAPLAERRAAALTLDSALLAELLGRAELRELLDPAVLAQTEAELQRLTPERRAHDLDSTADLLRLLGGLTTTEAVERGATESWLGELAASRRALRVRIAGEDRWIAIEDAGRVRDALGTALPVGVPEAFTEPVKDPLGDLVSRYARTHGPFHTAECAARLGLGVAVVAAALARLSVSGRVVSGEFRPEGSGTEWCDAEVLRTLRRRSLAALRKEVEPVSPEAYARFLPRWQHVALGGASRDRGMDALVRTVEQLQGVPVPASALEQLILPARVGGYAPAMLDELCAAGEVVWAGTGALAGGDGWLTLAFADTAPLLLPSADRDTARTPVHDAVLAALADGQAMFFRQLADRVCGAADRAGVQATDADLVTAIWDLVWAGELTNDTLAPLRTTLGSGRAKHPGKRTPSVRYRRPGRVSLPTSRLALPTRAGPPTAAGRWSRLPERESDPTLRAHAAAATLLERYGVLTRGAVAGEGTTGGFAAVYPVLAAYEDAGRVRRGYFVEGLGGAQFAAPGAVDRLRAIANEPAGDPDEDGSRRPGADEVAVLAAADPASPYGATLPWPDRAESTPEGGRGHQPGRKAGALVVLVRGRLVLYVERGGRTLLSWPAPPGALRAAAEGLAGAVTAGWLGTLAVERADGQHITTTPLAEALESAGFRPTPRGLRLRG
ncbi:MAG: ATP-dependent helicase Lhr and Lhr-like helicase [Cryptosporangiaceae bacterium]|nr:ATP-dependent helicase Lhr and Lhr-like helicase [Cryptosporangiaceae bacterium]